MPIRNSSTMAMGAMLPSHAAARCRTYEATNTRAMSCMNCCFQPFGYITVFPSLHYSATSQVISLPETDQPGRLRRANSSRYGPGEQRSIMAYCSSGLCECSCNGA